MSRTQGSIPRTPSQATLFTARMDRGILIPLLASCQCQLRPARCRTSVPLDIYVISSRRTSITRSIMCRPVVEPWPFTHQLTNSLRTLYAQLIPNAADLAPRLLAQTSCPSSRALSSILLPHHRVYPRPSFPHHAIPPSGFPHCDDSTAATRGAGLVFQFQCGLDIPPILIPPVIALVAHGHQCCQLCCLAPKCIAAAPSCHLMHQSHFPGYPCSRRSLQRVVTTRATRIISS